MTESSTSTTDPFDWKQLVTFDPNIAANRKADIIKVLDDMAQDKDGRQILENTLAARHGKPITIASEDTVITRAFGGVVNINYEKIQTGLFVDSETGELKPITLNRALSHEIAHTGDAKNDYIKYMASEEYKQAQQELTDINKNYKAAEAAANLAEDVNDPRMKKFEEMDTRRSNLEFIVNGDKFRHYQEVYAMEQENAYAAKKEGGATRVTHRMDTDIKLDHPPEKVIVLGPGEKLEDVYKDHQKITEKQIDDILMSTSNQEAAKEWKKIREVVKAEESTPIVEPAPAKGDAPQKPEFPDIGSKPAEPAPFIDAPAPTKGDAPPKPESPGINSPAAELPPADGASASPVKEHPFAGIDLRKYGDIGFAGASTMQEATPVEAHTAAPKVVSDVTPQAGQGAALA